MAGRTDKDYLIMRTVSNTEITSYNMCKRQHYYRFERRIEPTKRTLSPALYRGIVGHDALAAYYEAYRDKESVDSCKEQPSKLSKRKWVL